MANMNLPPRQALPPKARISSWPPPGDQYKKSLAQMEDLAWALKRAGGEIRDERGAVYEVIQPQLRRPELHKKSGSGGWASLRRTATDLEAYEVVVIEKKADARRTYGVKLIQDPAVLGIPEPPAPDPIPSNGAKADVKIKDVVVPDKGIEKPPEEGDEEVPITKPEQAPPPPDEEPREDDLGVLLIQAMSGMFGAMSMMTDAVARLAEKGAPRAVADAHWQKQWQKQKDRATAAEKDAEILRGKVKSLLTDLSEEKRLRKGLETNMEAVLSSARAWMQRAQDAGFMVSEELTQNVERLAQAVPGDVRQR